MKYLAFILIVCLCACSSTTKHPNSTQRVIDKALDAGFIQESYNTKTFRLTAFQQLPTYPTQTLHVYIEGDGNSWKTKYQLSDNPTPKQPLALTLAMRDPYSHVVYIARPCQYTAHSLDTLCNAKYWSSHRYAPEVIAAFDDVLNQLKEKNKNSHFVLIGFSGGASIATLIAAQRKDVSGLVTVAGDLNHVALNEYHHTTPLHGSLNPSLSAANLKNMPQHHFSGGRDKIVPPWLAEQFAKEVNNPACVKVINLKNVSHHKGWEDKWVELIQQPLKCS
jgi:predicted esterase